MKTILQLLCTGILFLASSVPSFALMGIMMVTKETAKELGIEVRSTPAGPDAVRVEVEFKPTGRFQRFNRAELEFEAEGKTLVSADLREDRSKPGCIVVSFVADRAKLDQIRLRIVAGDFDRTGYDMRIKDFVVLEKAR